MKLSTNFSDDEFFKPETYQALISAGHIPCWHINFQLCRRLQIIRDYFQKPIKITSGFATNKENIDRGSKSAWSFHKSGKAADFVVSGVDAEKVQAFIRGKWNSGGLGCSKDFTHIDTRNSETLIEWRYS